MRSPRRGEQQLVFLRFDQRSYRLAEGLKRLIGEGGLPELSSIGILGERPKMHGRVHRTDVAEEITDQPTARQSFECRPGKLF